MTIFDLAKWLASEWAWTRVDLDDVLLDLRTGTDDAPHLYLTEHTYSDAQRAVYGDRGCERIVRWEPGRHGDPLDVQAIARRAAEHLAQFVARNGQIWITLAAPRIRSDRRESIRIDSVVGNVRGWCAMVRSWEVRAKYAAAPRFEIEGGK